MYVIQREREEFVVDWIACTDMGVGGWWVTLNFLIPSCLYSK